MGKKIKDFLTICFNIVYFVSWPIMIFSWCWALHMEETSAVKNKNKIAQAMGYIERYGGIDGEHHKTWVIDQVARALKQEKYENWAVKMKSGEDGPNTYEWDEGIPP